MRIDTIKILKTLGRKLQPFYFFGKKKTLTLNQPNQEEVKRGT